MKKTNQISTAILAIVAVAMFVACKKEIDVSKSSAGTMINVQSVTKKPPTSYVGTGTLGDSTTQKGL